MLNHAQPVHQAKSTSGLSTAMMTGKFSLKACMQF